MPHKYVAVDFEVVCRAGTHRDDKPRTLDVLEDVVADSGFAVGVNRVGGAIAALIGNRLQAANMSWRARLSESRMLISNSRGVG